MKSRSKMNWQQVFFFKIKIKLTLFSGNFVVFVMIFCRLRGDKDRKKYEYFMDMMWFIQHFFGIKPDLNRFFVKVFDYLLENSVRIDKIFQFWDHNSLIFCAWFRDYLAEFRSLYWAWAERLILSSFMEYLKTAKRAKTKKLLFREPQG